jgi:DedD protein
VPKEAAPLTHPATPVRPVPAPPNTAPSAIPVGSFIVQVAAVSHPEDAQYVVAALKAKGYPAAARTEPQDKLFHIQVGPYTNRKDAETIKQRLSADGYNNPIVK